jgi:hypothetical protein
MRTGRVVATRADGARTTLDVEVPETDAEKAVGLSGRAALLPGWGMAFPFAPARLLAMTMAGVYFPLDMIFVDEGARVAWIEEATLARISLSVFRRGASRAGYGRCPSSASPCASISDGRSRHARAKR